ncbi:hypothetical protein ACQKWADRAFT_307291 [Trichoderma austrokoningii]
MASVFLRCEDEPLFLNALVFSFIETMERGFLKMEGLSMQGKIVQLMNTRYETHVSDGYYFTWRPWCYHAPQVDCLQNW